MIAGVVKQIISFPGIEGFYSITCRHFKDNCIIPLLWMRPY